MKWIAAWLVVAAGVSLAGAQQTTLITPYVVGSGGNRIEDQLQDDRVRHRPLAQADPALRSGRDQRQQAAVVAIRPPPPAPAGPRVRARELLLEDRLRVKRQVAIED